ncbi:hypothetical protein HKD37_10G029000 [Glycine soja]
MNQGQTTGISTANRALGGTSGFGLDEIISNAPYPSASSSKRSRAMLEYDVGGPVVNNALHQQERPSALAVPKVFPPFAGEFARDFQAPDQSSLFDVSQNTLHPELFYQIGNMEMGPNYGDYYFPVASPTAQGSITTGLGNGNYHFTAQLLGESSSTVQLPPTQESCPQVVKLQNPLGAANGAPPPFSPTTQWANNPNLQLPHSQLSTGLGPTPEMMQFRGLSSFSSGGRYSNGSQSNTQKQRGPKGNIHLIPKLREMGESSSSRSAKMKMTLPDNNQQSTELQLGTLLNPTTQRNGNPQPPRLMRNSLYDPIFEQMGLPIDPHLRMFVRRQEAYTM